MVLSVTDKLESNKPEKEEEPEELLYRDAAIEHLSNTSRLELELQLISYPRWIVWLSCFILILSLLIWSIFGSIPVKAQGIGIAVNAEGLLNVETPLNGIVGSLSARVGERVKKGQLLATLFNDVKETQLKVANARVQNLKDRLDKLQKQIKLEAETQKEAIQKEILAAQYKIHSLTDEIPHIQQDVKNQEELAQKGLFVYRSLQNNKELLWSKQMDLEKTKANLANFQFLLKKGYREEEFEALQEQLLQAMQDKSLLEAQLRYKNIFSPANGTILEWFVQPGGYIGLGDPAVRLEVQGAKRESIIFYGFLPLEVGKKIRTDTEVEIELTTVKAQEYGAILGKITRVSRICHFTGKYYSDVRKSFFDRILNAKTACSP